MHYSRSVRYPALQALVISVSTALFGAPAAPALDSPADDQKNQTLTPSLSWVSTSGATSYRLQVSTTPDFSSTVYDQSGITGTSQSVSSGLAESSIGVGTPVEYGTNPPDGFNDNPRTMVRKGSTNTFRSFEGFNDVIFEGTIAKPVATALGSYSWSWNGDNTHELSWIMAAYNPSGDTLVGYVHTEDQGQTRYAVGLALSTNFGSAWTYLGDVASHDVTRNVGGGMMIMMNGYLYMYYNGSGLNVCRSPVDSVMIAARQKTVTKWMTYSNGAWTVAALTGTGTRTFPGDAHAGATVVKSTGTVLAIPNSGVNTTTTTLYASTDGLTTYQTFAINAPGSVYGNFAGTAGSGARTDHFEVGDSFYVFWDHKEGGNYNDDHFYRAPITVAPRKYYWRVSATDASGAGAWSAIRSFTTRAAIQTGAVGVTSPSGSPNRHEYASGIRRFSRTEWAVTFATPPGRSSMQSGMIRLYDMHGRVVGEVTDPYVNQEMHTATFTTEALGPGRYVVRGKAAGIDYSVPFVLSR